MKQMSPPVADVRTHFIADSHGARYATLGEDHVELVEPVGRHGRIVVGVDGSEESVTALRRGVRIANALNASVEAVSSWRLPETYANVTYANLGEVEYSPLEDADAILSGATKSVFGAKRPQWFTTATFEGNAADVLIEQSVGAEMLIVGSRGHGEHAGEPLGSVSATCAERAHCAVLIIH
jgi:nucleotide-binding universal stress UspA family protein